mgnify:CR=1 FL=1
MKTCEEVTLLIESENYKVLSRQDRLASKVHLMMCKGCKNYKKDSKFIHKMLQAKFKDLSSYEFSLEEKTALQNKLSKEG